jgi:hypothetical protein
MRIKLFEGFSRSHPQYTEQEIKQGISDCLVELNDLGDFEYEINIDLNDNYICVVINVDESDVPDEEYFYTTKTFDSLEITEPVLLLENYITEKFDRIITEYWFYYQDNIEVFHEFPSEEDMNELEENGEDDRVDTIFHTEKLIIKYRLNQ